MSARTVESAVDALRMLAPPARRRSGGGTLVLSMVLAGGLAVLNGWLWSAPPDVRPSAVPVLLAEALQKPDPQRGIVARGSQSERFPLTLERPLFSPTRRQPVAEPLPPPTPPAVIVPEQAIAELPPAVIVEPEISPVPRLSHEGFVAKGILVKDRQPQALVASPALPEGRWITIGDDFQGWRITRITPGAVEMTADGVVVNLKLYEILDNSAAGLAKTP